MMKLPLWLLLPAKQRSYIHISISSPPFGKLSSRSIFSLPKMSASIFIHLKSLIFSPYPGDLPNLAFFFDDRRGGYLPRRF